MKNDWAIIIGVLAGAWLLSRWRIQPTPSDSANTPAPSVNPVVMLTVPQNPGTGPMPPGPAQLA